jgi:hypothetical protein
LLFIGIAQAASCVGMSYSFAWQLDVAEAEVVVEVVVTGMMLLICDKMSEWKYI